MNETTVNGLLIQKANSPVPNEGEERWFSWEQRQGKSGKAYIKIKNDSPEYGGTLCRILGAEKTDFVDAHGNVSFNVEFEQVIAGKCGSDNNDFIPMTHDAKGAALPGVDEAKFHVMQAANLYNICANIVSDVIHPNITGMTAELYQSAVASLFIEASRSGLITKMPKHPIK